MPDKKIKLSNSKKILATMYLISEGSAKPVKFEDLVVEIFKAYPNDFHLPGYKQFPDPESVRRPMHEFRKIGLINMGNKVYSLTEMGMEHAKQILESIEGKKTTSTTRILPKFAQGEINRIKSTEGFLLFSKGQNKKITETDYYNYVGVTPRTLKSDFAGRLSIVSEAISMLDKKEDTSPTEEAVIKYHKFIMGKFKDIAKLFST